MGGGIFGRLKLFEDLSEQLRLHIEERAGQLTDEGLSPQEAEHQARIAFANLALVEERSREVWRWPTLESTWADVLIRVRSLRRSPGFAIASVMTVAPRDRRERPAVEPGKYPKIAWMSASDQS